MLSFAPLGQPLLADFGVSVAGPGLVEVAADWIAQAVVQVAKTAVTAVAGGWG